jgi:hypothetical protein
MRVMQARRRQMREMQARRRQTKNERGTCEPSGRGAGQRREVQADEMIKEE